MKTLILTLCTVAAIVVVCNAAEVKQACPENQQCKGIAFIPDPDCKEGEQCSPKMQFSAPGRCQDGKCLTGCMECTTNKGEKGFISVLGLSLHANWASCQPKEKMPECEEFNRKLKEQLKNR